MEKIINAVLSFFCAGFIIVRMPDGKWYALCVRDTRFSDVKAGGGTNEPEETDPAKVLCRELAEEIGVVPEEFKSIHEEEHRNHTKYFFLVTKISILPPLDFSKIVEVTEGGKVTERLEVRYLELNEFADHLYSGQHKAFGKAIAELAVDQEFFRKYLDLLRLFPG